METLRSYFRPVRIVIHRGVTLVELLVVLAIIATLSGMVIMSQGTFNKTILLSNTAYDLALTIRSAETFGLGSKVAGDTFNAGYGVHFNIANQTQFILFADAYADAGACHVSAIEGDVAPDATPGDCVYNASPVDEAVQTYVFGNGVKVDSGGLCVYKTGSYDCGVDTLDIVFARPNTKTHFASNDTYDEAGDISKARIKLVSPQGGERYVCVLLTGEIHVSTNDNCT